MQQFEQKKVDNSLLELIGHLCLFLLFTYTMSSLQLLINISIVLKQHIVENEGFTDKPTNRNMNENMSQKLENSWKHLDLN